MRADTAIDTRGRLLAASLLGEGMVVRIRVHGTSMWPSLVNGAEVELEPLTVPPRPGDIVLTEVQGEGQRLHRVSRLRPGGWLQTRGDACLRLDAAVPSNAVLGRVRQVRNHAGNWRRCAPGSLSRLLAWGLRVVSGLALVLGLTPNQRGPARHPFRNPG